MTAVGAAVVVEIGPFAADAAAVVVVVVIAGVAVPAEAFEIVIVAEYLLDAVPNASTF